jgi:hypothetical protein
MTLTSRTQAVVLAVVVSLLLGGLAQAKDKVLGTGTTGTIPQWTAPDTLGDSVMVQSSNNIGIGTSTPAAKLEVNGNIQADGGIGATGAINTGSEYQIGGNRVLGVDGDGNIAVGLDALQSNTDGEINIAVGTSALFSNTSGSVNVAVGFHALQSNTDGDGNIAVGRSALQSNTTGGANIAVGTSALFSNTSGSVNVAVGETALLDNTDGSGNIAVGRGALAHSTGTVNIAIGEKAGILLTTGDNNIYLGTEGRSAESDTIRIGGDGSGAQTRTFVRGIYNVTTGGAAVPVLVDASGQLGTVSSSRRVKNEIQDMGQASQKLLKLRPVTFHYKQPLADGSRPLQYGLIAEEVSEVYPELVATDKEGRPWSVLYHELPALLLNELQTQQRQIEAQAVQVQTQAAELAALKARLVRLEAALDGQAPAHIALRPAR